MRGGWKVALGVLVIGVLIVATIFYTIFQWSECRKDPDHTFWHCVQVIDS